MTTQKMKILMLEEQVELLRNDKRDLQGKLDAVASATYATPLSVGRAPAPIAGGSSDGGAAAALTNALYLAAYRLGQVEAAINRR